MSSPAFIVLLGPPGTGQSYCGALLERELCVRFFEAELWLLQQYGGVEQFAASKVAALRAMYQHLRELAAASDEPVIFESTGLSDADHLRALCAERAVALVRVDADAALCAQRVASRERGRNFSNDESRVEAFHAYWRHNVASQWDCALRIESGRQSDEEVVTTVAASLQLRPRTRAAEPG